MAKFRFLLKEGKHEGPSVSNGRGEVYHKGDVIESDQELDNLFGKNKFKRLRKGESGKGEDGDEDESTEKEPSIPAKQKLKKGEPLVGDVTDNDNVDDTKASKKTKEEESEAERLTGIESSLGENVTSDFPDAVEGGLIVLKEGREYRVAEADEPDEMLPSEEPLSSKVKVHEFIKSQVK